MPILRKIFRRNPLGNLFGLNAYIYKKYLGGNLLGRLYKSNTHN